MWGLWLFRESVWFILFYCYFARISRPILALSRCISACIGQQTGFARFDEWHRNSRRKIHFFSSDFLNLSSMWHLSFQSLDLRSITTHHWKIWACSAVTGANLVSGLDWVVNDVAGRLYYSTMTDPSQSTKDLLVNLDWALLLFPQSRLEFLGTDGCKYLRHRRPSCFLL